MGRRRIQRCNTTELRDLVDPVGGKWFRPINSFDEVFPGVLLGDADTALSTQEIKEHGITHILNAAQGTNNHAYSGYVGTNPTYYAKLRGIKFMGIPAMDMPGFYIRPYLRQAADFINKALKEGGRVLVHCQCGISRSAALVIAFLMLKRGMNVQSAVSTVKKKRNIYPNQGFLSQLCDLDYELRRSGELPAENVERPASPIITEREPSPIRNPSAYPRFTLVPTRVMDTYTSTKNFVVPRRASSCDRFEPPRKTFQDHPLLDSPLWRDSRSASPGRRLSLPYTSSYDDDDEDVSPKVFDTYKRYARSVTSPPRSTYISRPYDPYVSLLKYPWRYYYDRYSNDIDYEYLKNLNKYYDSYRYLRAKSPFLASGATLAPASPYKNYERTYLVGSGTYLPTYPYTQRYIPSVANYPATYRTVSSALSPIIWI